MRSLAVIGPDKLEIVEIPKPEVGYFDILVKSEATFICNATDRKIVQGHFPGMEKSAYPVLLGHENAGTVEAVGEKVCNFKPGDRVIGGLLLESTHTKYSSGWGGFSDYVIAKDYEAMINDSGNDGTGVDEVFRIMKTVPDDIPVEAAGLLCTWREVYAGFQDFSLQGRESLVIFGAGPVGLSFVTFARMQGFSDIICIDPISEKRELAKELGADAVFSPIQDVGSKIEEYLGGKVDAVIDAVGNIGIINTALTTIKLGGSVCVYGVLSEDMLQLHKGAAPYNFNLYVHQWPTREYEAEAQEPLCAWIREGKLDWRKFVTSAFPLDDFSQAYSTSQDPLSIKTMITF